MITKAELIRKLAKRAGVPDSELKVFFEIYLKKLSELLASGDAAFVEGLGYFHSVKGEINKSSLMDIEDDDEFVYLDLLLFSEEKTFDAESKENLLFSIPTLRQEEYNPIDSFLSLSIGKPVIPLKGIKDTEFFIPLSGLELRRLVDSKVDKAISHLKILPQNTEGSNVILIDTDVYNPNQFEFNWSSDSSDNQNLKTDEELYAAESSELNKNFEDLTWNFGENLAKQIEEESILDFEKPGEEEISGEGLSWDFGPLYLEDEEDTKEENEEPGDIKIDDEYEPEKAIEFPVQKNNDESHIQTEQNIEQEQLSEKEKLSDDDFNIDDEEEINTDDSIELPDINDTEFIDLKKKHDNSDQENKDQQIDHLNNEASKDEFEASELEDKELEYEKLDSDILETDEEETDKKIFDDEDDSEILDESIEFDFSKNLDDENEVKEIEEKFNTEFENEFIENEDNTDSIADDELNIDDNLEDIKEKPEDLEENVESIFDEIDLNKFDDMEFDKISSDDEKNIDDENIGDEIDSEEKIGNYKRVKSIFSKFETSGEEPELSSGFDLINEIFPKSSEAKQEKTKDGFVKVKSRSVDLKIEPVKNQEVNDSEIPELSDDYFIRHNDDEKHSNKNGIGKGVKFKDRSYNRPNRSSAIGFIIAAIVLILIIAGIYLVIRLTQNEKSDNQSELPVNVSASSFSEIIKRNFDIPVMYPYPKNQKDQNDFNPISTELLKSNKVSNSVPNGESAETEPKQKSEPVKPKTDTKTNSVKENLANRDIMSSNSRLIGNNIYKYGDVYVLQVSSWPTKEKALEQADRYNSSSVTAFIEKADIPGRGTWYRVRVGNFKSYEDALSYKNNLK